MKKIVSKKNLFISFILSFSFLSANLYAQTTTASAGLDVSSERIRNSNEGFAAEEFRRGVQAYYRGAFNESIMQFEKSLSYLPDDNLILEWLGKAYYKSGMEGTALSYWQTALNNGYGGLLLENKVEIVRERRVTGDSVEKSMRLTEAGSFSGKNGENLLFSGPVAVLPNYDGTMWVASYGSNELLLINQNGLIISRSNGPVNGFDHPSDIIRLNDGNILVCETAGDRLAVLDEHGIFKKYIGERGRGKGQMTGPVYADQDSLDRIYVTDYGNRRVDVFDGDGNGLFFFGTKSSDFEGLKGPTGICVYNDSIFVADDQKGGIYEFDTAGNFVKTLVEDKTFKKAEALSVWNGNLVICDQNRIIAVDPDTGALFEYVRTGNAPSRVTMACPDVNQNLIVTDYASNEIYIMSKIQELVGGLFVQIEEVDASAFPEVKLGIKVENRHRQPVVGLQETNFYITENKRPVVNQKFIGSASNNTEADVTIVIDRSVSCEKYASEIEVAVKEIAEGMNNKGVLRVVSAGKNPVTEYIGTPDGVKDFTLEALKTKAAETVPADLAFRLAANDLIKGAKKRSIIFISDGESLTFNNYNLAELTAFMNNNSVGFSLVTVSQSSPSESLSYIVNNTAGDSYYVYRPEGLKGLVKDVLEYPQGYYQLSFQSSLPTNFGQNYLPVEAEIYLLNRSGRDESGYFSPLE